MNDWKEGDRVLVGRLLPDYPGLPGTIEAEDEDDPPHPKGRAWWVRIDKTGRSLPFFESYFEPIPAEANP